MKYFIALFAITVLSFMPSLAQVESSFSSLLNVPSARLNGMAQSGIGLIDDASANRLNPAALAFFRGHEIGVTHTNSLPQLPLADLFYDALTTSNHFEALRGTISASIVYLNRGEFNRRDEFNNDLETFKAYEFSVTGGYSTKLSTELGVGINLRFIHNALEPQNLQNQPRGVGSTVSLDLGALYRPVTSIAFIEDRLSIGLNLSNIGPKISYIQMAEAKPLPTNLGIGLGFRLLETESNTLNFVADINRILLGGYKMAFSTGAEYWYGNPKLFAFRLGYINRNSDLVADFFTYGAGLVYGVFGIDISYESYISENHPLNETLFFTLHVNWGK
jgi:hypothetical protein